MQTNTQLLTDLRGALAALSQPKTFPADIALAKAILAGVISRAAVA